MRLHDVENLKKNRKIERLIWSHDVESGDAYLTSINNYVTFQPPSGPISPRTPFNLDTNLSTRHFFTSIIQNASFSGEPSSNSTIYLYFKNNLIKNTYY
jgi:hypothetical protein